MIRLFLFHFKYYVYYIKRTFEKEGSERVRHLFFNRLKLSLV